MTPFATDQKIAILYQALPPPTIGTLRKDAKPGGYSDSGADIGFCLRRLCRTVLTPKRDPDPAVALDWVFPDTAQGIEAALDTGASVLWANTVLFSGHPIERVMGSCWIIGQLPSAMHAADDKFATNALLRAHGLPVARSVLAGRDCRPGVHSIAALTVGALADLELRFPLIVKPVRGRGSQGVTLAEDHPAFVRAAQALIASGRFGDEIIVEQFLGGPELTITIMPGNPSSLRRDEPASAPWALPPVCRFNHIDGVAPYNGVVAVTANSRALLPEEATDPAVGTMIAACTAAAPLVRLRAPIRIDCRADAEGVFHLFDLNMKPNMTGAGRPGHDDQDSLSAIAARAIGWSYGDLLLAMVAGAWRENPPGVR